MLVETSIASYCIGLKGCSVLHWHNSFSYFPKPLKQLCENYYYILIVKFEMFCFYNYLISLSTNTLSAKYASHFVHLPCLLLT